MGFLRNIGNKLRTLPVNALPKNIINFITKRLQAQQQQQEKRKLYNLGADFEIAKLIKYDSVQLPHDKFLTISGLSNGEHMRNAVKEILIPRVVGTDGHRHVRNYIVDSLRRLHWTVELHKFVDTVPVLGELTFHNIIAKLNPNAKRYLVLACHYDSKYMPDVEFVGATDSAVPCAMLLNLAEVLHAHLERFREQSAEVSLMLLFFDGEEAFKQWGPKDSIYGARHLAKKWEKEGFLDSMDLLVLLDLLGTPDPKFYSFFENTESWYSVLMDIEERLSNTGLMERYASSSVTNYDPHRYFQANALRGSQVEDDHLPFLRRNVPVLHLIPMPFPSVWHTKDDNDSVIDYATTENLNRILRIFTLEYLMGSVEGEGGYDDDMQQNETK